MQRTGTESESIGRQNFLSLALCILEIDVRKKEIKLFECKWEKQRKRREAHRCSEVIRYKEKDMDLATIMA